MGEGAAPRAGGAGLRQLPGDGAGLHVDRAEDLLGRVVRRLLGRSAVVRFAGLPLAGLFRVDGALLERLHVVEGRGRVERGGEPVGGAFDGRADLRAFGGRLLPGIEHGTAVGADLACPGELLDKRFCSEKLAGGAVEHIEEAVAVGVEQEPARLALPVDIHEHGRLLRVPVPEVVRGVLVVPLQPAAPGVERHDRVGVEVVADAFAAVVVRAGIAGRPIERLEIGVVGAREPGGRARVVDVQTRHASFPVA